VSTRPGQTLSTLRDATWIAGCADEGFEPRIGYTSDDMVVMHALVVAGLGVTTMPGLALRAHRIKGIVASELPESHQHVYAATYGEPPDPPATTALLAAIAEVARAVRQTLDNQRPSAPITPGPPGVGRPGPALRRLHQHGSGRH
jgi:DNA-binding transcriptional LysR family regulator